MKKLIVVFLFVLVVITMLTISFNQQNVLSPPSQQEDLQQPISKPEPDGIPVSQKWKVINELTQTMSIEIVCPSSSYEIVDEDLLNEIVDSIQHAKDMEHIDYHERDADLKLYFKKADGIIMAGRLYGDQGVLVSPDGPIIEISAETAKKIMDIGQSQLDCL